jgi:SAM-dependent methyltransferase
MECRGGQFWSKAGKISRRQPSHSKPSESKERDNMDLTRERVEDLYQKVSAEYNVTPLAVDQGWVYQPNGWGLVEMLAIAKHLPSNGVFVDLGTGMGIAPRFAKMLGAHVTTIDSLAAGGNAIDNARAAGIIGYSCDIELDPFPIESGSVDCVFFGDVIEHLHNSPRPVLNEIFRILKPGGVCICATPNAVRLTVRVKVLMGFTNWANIREYFDEKMHFGHHHEYTIDEVKFVFEKTGFELSELVLYENNLRDVKISGMNELKTQSRNRASTRPEPVLIAIAKMSLLSLTNLFPHLRSNMLLVSRKPAL